MNLRVGVIGRTGMLLRSARAIASAGYTLSFVQTCRPEPHYDVGIAEFRELAESTGATFFESARIGATAAALAETATDVAISVNWPTLISGDAHTLFRHGILNAHAGDLPRYRGNACPNWAILAFESEVGLTIHRMTAELDAGPWLYRTHLSIDETTYIGDVYRWLEETIPDAFVAALGRLTAGGFVDQSAATRPLRAFPRRPEDGRIEWREPARNVIALIRASSHPFAGAFTCLEGRDEIRIWRAERFMPDFDHLAVPGQVCLGVDGDPVVAAGDGLVRITECTAEGRGSAATKATILGSLRNRLG
jgi:UDP-4-amino-4-deoxy-L-arabinose formyltransferase/UDP-glucuronic acid dehydrogenase (UDP-4-keto-hexauronic acid decarboxylating)